MSELIGHWAFIIGIILAVIVGAGLSEMASLPVVLLVLGLIVGLLNVKERESTPFLVSVIALLLIGVAGLQVGEGLSAVMVSILNNFIAFVAAAGLVVALKQALVIVKPA